MIFIWVFIYISIFYLYFHFFSGFVDFCSFFYSLFLHCFMFLVCLLRWCISMCALSNSCFLIILSFAFLLFRSFFWDFFFVLWIFGILINNDPLFLFRIHIDNMIYSFCRSDRNSDLVHSDLFIVVRFLSSSFILQFHYIMLSQFSCVFLSWYVIIYSQF